MIQLMLAASPLWVLGVGFGLIAAVTACTTHEDGRSHPQAADALVLPRGDAKAGTLGTTGGTTDPTSYETIADIRKTPEYQNCDEAAATVNQGFYGPELTVELADVVVTAPRFVLYQHPSNPAQNLYGYFVADPGGGPDSGVVLSLDAAETSVFEVGTHLAVSGESTSYFCNTQLRATALSQLDNGGDPVEPAVVTPSVLADAVSGEAYEGALVKFTRGTVTATPNKFGEFQIDGVLFVGDLYPYDAPQLGELVSITGVMNYSFGKRLLEPRSDADIEKL